MSWNDLAPRDGAEPAGVDAVPDLVARCARRAIAGGGAAVTAALEARSPDLARACEAATSPADVLAAGLGLVMLDCAGKPVDLSPIGPAVARVAPGAAPDAVMRLSILASAAGAFDVALSLASPTASLDEPLAELAWCLTDGPLDGLHVPWRIWVDGIAADSACADRAADVVLVTAAAQRRVHLLTVDRAGTLDALHRALVPGA